MTHPDSLLMLLSFWGGSVATFVAKDVRLSRRIAITAAAIGTGAAFSHALSSEHLAAAHQAAASSSLLIAPDTFGGAVLPVAVGLVGLVAIAISPIHHVTSATFSRILTITVLSMMAMLANSPVVVAVLAMAASLPVWFELHSRAESQGAARAFAWYMGASAVLITSGAAFQHFGYEAAAIPALGLGLAIRQGIMPFHGWLPALVARAPLGISMAFAAPQVGMYAFLALLAGGLAPELSQAIAVLGGLTAIGAAGLSTVQTSPRRALAYLMASQGGLLALGLQGSSPVAHAGALVAWMALGVAFAGFGMAIAALEARRGPLSLERPSGNFERVPRLGTAFLLLGLGVVGLPGTIGFVSEDLLMQGSGETWPLLAATMVVATALNATTIMRAFFWLFMGTARHQGEQDLTRREGVAFSLILAALLVGGIWPSGLVDSLTGHAEMQQGVPPHGH